MKEPIAEPKVDKGLIKKLTDMGFEEKKAKKALTLNKYEYIFICKSLKILQMTNEYIKVV